MSSPALLLMAKKYMVTRLTRRKIDSIQVDGKTLDLGKKTNSCEVNDPGLAREIEARLGPKGTGDVVVAAHEVTDPGHRRTFSVPALPWKKE